MTTSNTLTALKALIRKDLVLYFSNRRALIMSIAAPIVIAAFFGSLFGSGSDKPSRVPIAVVDADGSAISKAVTASLKSDTTFEVRELAEPAAIEAARQGKVRAAIVLPAGFGVKAPAALIGSGEKPSIALHYDPSQATALPMVRGLLTQHVMKAVGESMGGSAGGGAAKSAFSAPYDTQTFATTSGADRPYNGYAHSFAGMGVQFILFMGIEVGVGVLLARRLGLWKRLRAAPLSRWRGLGFDAAIAPIAALLFFSALFAAIAIWRFDWEEPRG